MAAAYEVLSDADKRETYDRYGEEAVNEQTQREQQGGGAGDPFGDFFSHFGGFGGRRREQERRTPDVVVPLSVTLEQLYLGEVMELKYYRQVLCLNYKDCEKADQSCHGPGVRVRTQRIAPGFVQQVQQADPRCVARGKAWRSKCKACPGGKTNKEAISLTMELQSGMKHNDPIIFEETADEEVGHRAGDLVFVVQQAPHRVFDRRGDDLYMGMTIGLVDALAGFETTFAHLDGHSVTVRKADVTECGDMYRIQGEGMPVRGSKRRGNLFITFDIDFPKKVTDEQKKILRKAFA